MGMYKASPGQYRRWSAPSLFEKGLGIFIREVQEYDRTVGHEPPPKLDGGPVELR